MKRESKKITLLFMLIFLMGLTGCSKMKDSGQKSQNTDDSVNENESEELVLLRTSNSQLSEANEALKTKNAEMQERLVNLEKRDEKLSQKISDMKVDLRQQTLLSAGLLEDKKTLETENQELKANLDAWKKQKTLPVGAGK
jgi:hypothetical protein